MPPDSKYEKLQEAFTKCVNHFATMANTNESMAKNAALDALTGPQNGERRADLENDARRYAQESRFWTQAKEFLVRAANEVRLG